MTRFLTFALFLTFVEVGLAFQKWNGLRATFCMGDPDPHCFQAIPRTVREAVAAGYRQTSGGCHHGGQFAGRRFVKGDDVSLSPLYDIRGTIAGIQMNIRKDELASTVAYQYYYSRIPEFLDNEINGHSVYSLTFYYVDPHSICSIGRTDHELKSHGTGNGLWVQAGPNTHWLNLIRAPLYRDAAIKLQWDDNLCVPTMGHHNYYDVPHMQETNCTLMRPWFLLYNNVGELHGYGAVAVGHLLSKSFEHPDVQATITGLGDRTPECMKDIAKPEGPHFSNIHMYLFDNPKDYRCDKIIQAKHSSNIYTSPHAKDTWDTYHVDV